MELTIEEMRKACEIASKEVERRMERYKPDKPVIRNSEGWICQQTFKGSVGDELVCSVTLQWNYPSAGAVGRITQIVHARFRCFSKPDGGRFLRLVNLHMPQWEGEGCQQCGSGFQAGHVIVADTSLQEY